MMVSTRDGRVVSDEVLEQAPHCGYCGGLIDRRGFHYTCHVCGSTYCYIHMHRHRGAHPLPPANG